MNRRARLSLRLSAYIPPIYKLGTQRLLLNSSALAAHIGSGRC